MRIQVNKELGGYSGPNLKNTSCEMKLEKAVLVIEDLRKQCDSLHDRCQSHWRDNCDLRALLNQSAMISTAPSIEKALEETPPGPIGLSIRHRAELMDKLNETVVAEMPAKPPIHIETSDLMRFVEKLKAEMPSGISAARWYTEDELEEHYQNQLRAGVRTLNLLAWNASYSKIRVLTYDNGYWYSENGTKLLMFFPTLWTPIPSSP